MVAPASLPMKRRGCANSGEIQERKRRRRREASLRAARRSVFFEHGTGIVGCFRDKKSRADVTVEFSIFLTVLESRAKCVSRFDLVAHGEVVHLVAVQAEFDSFAEGGLGILVRVEGGIFFHDVLSEESDGNIYAEHRTVQAKFPVRKKNYS